jgi:hypothetical protein
LASLSTGPVELMQPDNAKQAAKTTPASAVRTPISAFFMTEFNDLCENKGAS